jgi:hypothetical protein
VNGANYVDDVPDSKASAGAIISLTNDVPVTSTLPVPVGTTLSVAISVPQGGGLTVVDVADATNISVAQQVTIGLDTDDNQETVIVISLVSGGFTAWVQNPHAIGDPVKAESRYGQPCNICVVAFNTMWMAGDVNNPHFLYYSTAFSPESFGAANQIEVGTPDDPITAIVPFNGTLYVSTRRRWWAISPGTQGGTPTPYPTSVAHGVVAPFAWVEVEKEIWFRSMDGIRSFSGGGATYRTQEIEFVMQGVGTTPVPIADPAQVALTRMAYYNNIVFVSYMALDGKMHRIVYHTIYNRWRNDDIQASAMLWEDDINSLLYGTPQGSLYQDRVGFFDEQSTNPISQRAIPINIISGYMDQGALKFQKNYNEVTIEADTQGQDLAVSILFDDAQTSIALGTINTVGRFRKNFPVNSGLGQAAYRAALQITGSVTQKTLVYQAHMNVVQLAAIRRSFDTYDLKFGIDESKILKQMYVEYTAPTSPIVVNVYYDQRATPLVLTLPVAQTRLAMRVRLPAIKFRIFRLVMNSISDFQLWPDSKFEVKPVVATKSYQTFDMVP